MTRRSSDARDAGTLSEPPRSASHPDRYVLGFDEVDRTGVAVVGGKAARLGELTRIAGITVPPGFCVTTAAYRRIIADAPSIDVQLDQLAGVDAEDREAVRALSAGIRQSIGGVPIPENVALAITSAVVRLGEDGAYAIRSSATGEDLSTVSFAGQHETYLNVVGASAILEHISRCWASLFTERAVAYRVRNGFDHREVEMAVVVQRMVTPRASGVLFTADPVTGNRTVASVEATFGLGEALVSGVVSADACKVRDGEVVDRTVATKPIAVRASPGGGTKEEAIEPAQQTTPVLSDEEVLQLALLGREIEVHLGAPQDIEWCLDHGGFEIVQSRPITTLFPIPDIDDGANHVYVSVGHQQMMTDPMKPLGLSIWQLTSPAPMRVAGGRLFVDVTARLGSPSARAGLLEVLGRSDPLMRDALETIIDRPGFLPPSSDDGPPTPPATAGAPEPMETDPAIVAALIERNRASIAALRREIATKSGPELFDFIRTDLDELKRLLFDPQSHQAVMAGMEATWWLNDHLHEWLGEPNVADALSLFAPNNVTAEMGLALLDVADAIRPHPQVVAFLREVDDDGFLDELDQLEGARPARDGIVAYLDTYGMRCVGEIDITRPRWRERPSALLPMILANVENFGPGERVRRVEHGRQQARSKERDVLERLRALPGGANKADETKRMIDRLRTFIGYREYPKYGMVARYDIYKQALLEEADQFVHDGVLDDAEDISFLTFHELHDVVRTRQADHERIGRRKDEFQSHRAMRAPRVLTSEGEALDGAYHRGDLPSGALVGLPVSTGVIEGRARVVLDLADAADVEPGDILVTAATDPSWSPLFVTIAGLVTEVGGLMTHGAVIAREYGLTAVVGVGHATRLISDGQYIRVNGTDGYVEILPDVTATHHHTSTTTI